MWIYSHCTVKTENKEYKENKKRRPGKNWKSESDDITRGDKNRDDKSWNSENGDIAREEKHEVIRTTRKTLRTVI